MADQDEEPKSTVLPLGARALPSIRAGSEDKRVDERIVDIATGLHWYALFSPPGKEFVAQKILRRYGLATFVPVRREWRRRNKFVKQKELREYAAAPRYVFAGFHPGVPLWFDLFQLPVISGVLGRDGEPVRLPIKPMLALIRRTGGGLNAPLVQKFMRTHHEFSVGQRVEVISGPFEGRAAPVVAITGFRAKLLMELFGSDLEVELPTEILQAAA